MSHSKTSIFVFAIGAITAMAQVTTSRIDGTVEDSSGAVVVGARVSVVQTATLTASQTTSNKEGNFVFTALTPGKYVLTVEAPGFRKEVLSDIELTVAGTFSEIVKLQVGQTNESVTIDASAPLVQTTDSQIGEALNMKALDTLPQLARTPITLAIFQPGVQIDIRAGQDASYSHVNGLRQGSNNSTLDGINVNDSVAPRLGLSLTATNTDSVEQLNVITAGFKPEYGRNAGGELQLITRSGTNEYHGNVFDYLRNTDLNANDFFNNQSGGAVPQFIQNIYGGSFGGPIVRNKTFIFGNFQGRRTHQQTVHERTVPSLLARQGIFQYKDAGGNIQQYNIAKNDPLHIGIDPTVAALLALYPVPNNNDVGDGLNTQGYRFNNAVPGLEDQFTIKADHHVTENNALFLRWSWQRNTSIDNLNNADATYPGQPQGSQGGHRWGFAAGWNWVINPTVVNDFSAGHQSATTDFLRPNRPQGPAFVSNEWTDLQYASFAQGRNSPVNQFNDAISKVWHNHTFKAGVDVEITKQYGYNYSGVYPTAYTTVANGASVPSGLLPAGLSGAVTNNFNNLYNDILGRISQVQLTYYSDLATYQAAGTPRVRTFDYNYSGFFLQDDWRISRKLTLNYGVRYEYFGVPKEENGFQGTLTNASQIDGIHQIDNLSIQRSSQWYGKDLNNFAPRFGFAYDLTGDGKTAIRGGFGIFYDRAIGSIISSVDGNTPGFSLTANAYPDLNGGDFRYSQGLPTPTTPSSTPTLTPANNRNTSVTIFNPHLRTGYVESYNLTIERQLPGNNVLTAGYVGNRGVKLFYNRDVNQPRVSPDFVTAFNQIAAYAANTSTAVPSDNLFVRVFGSPAAALSSVGASNFTLGNVGTVIRTVDITNYAKVNAAGISEYYFRAYPQFNQVILGTNDGRSYFDSLQIRISHRSRNLQATVNYTFSKAIDNISAEGNGFTAPIDSFNLTLNKALADFDRPHSLNAFWTYTLPVGNGQKFASHMPKILDTALGGWDVGGELIDQIGQPFSVLSQHGTVPVSGVPAAGAYATFTGTDRSIGSVSRQGNGVFYFTPDQMAQFTSTPTAAFSVGNAGRNVFRNPWFNELDMSLIKRFRITERQLIVFRAEAFNVFNHPNFGLAAANLNVTQPASFGKFSSTLGTQNGSTSARTMQLALRYEF